MIDSLKAFPCNGETWVRLLPYEIRYTLCWHDLLSYVWQLAFSLFPEMKRNPNVGLKRWLKDQACYYSLRESRFCPQHIYHRQHITSSRDPASSSGIRGHLHACGIYINSCRSTHAHNEWMSKTKPDVHHMISNYSLRGWRDRSVGRALAALIWPEFNSRTYILKILSWCLVLVILAPRRQIQADPWPANLD